MPMAFDTVYDLTRSNQAALISAAYLIFGKNIQVLIIVVKRFKIILD